MDDDFIPVYDSESDHSQTKFTWAEDDWIGCGRTYKDVPAGIVNEYRRLTDMPAEFSHHIPSKILTVQQFLRHNLPACMNDRQFAVQITFSDQPPADVIDSLWFDPIISPTTQIQLERALGQAWFDGKKSLQLTVNGLVGGLLPFWVVTYFPEMRRACLAHEKWRVAVEWMADDGGLSTEAFEFSDVEEMFAVIPWCGRLPGILKDIHIEDLAEVLGDIALRGDIVDGLLNLQALRLRSDPESSDVAVIATTTLADHITSDPNVRTSSKQRYLDKYGTSMKTNPHRSLYLVVHSPPFHWASCKINFEEHTIQYGDSLQLGRPVNFFRYLPDWLHQHFPETDFKITDDLLCAYQNDAYSCPIIAVNTIAHAIFHDALWTPRTARALRMKAFCDLVGDLEENDEPAASDLFPHHFDADVDVDPKPDSRMDVEQDTKREKRKATRDPDVDDKPRNTKRPKQTLIHPFFNPASESSKTKAPPPTGKQKPSASTSSVPGQSLSAIATRQQRRTVNHGSFQVSAKKWSTFQEKCRLYDSDVGFDSINKPQCAQCSNCKQWVIMQEVYHVARFRNHIQRDKPCKAPPPPDKKVRTFDDWKSAFTPIEKQHFPVRKVFVKPCPGLTKALEAQVGKYLDSTMASGGGSKDLKFFSSQLYDTTYEKLGSIKRARVRVAQLHGRTWRNDTSPGIMAVFATGTTHPCVGSFNVKEEADIASPLPCEPCHLILKSRSFQNAIHKLRASDTTLKYVPKMFSNPTLGHIYARYKGVQGLFTEENSKPILLRYAHHVLNGDFKDDQVFLGMVEAMVLAKGRELRGKGMQNFKFAPEYNAFMHLVHTVSPRAYRAVSLHLKTRTPRSIKQQVSSGPRFPIGIQESTYELASKYCNDYGYPASYPLVLSVDDTKLFASLQPLFDGTEGQWYVVGGVGETAIKIPDIESLEKFLEAEKYEKATKVRLWVLQIPLPGVPPLALAILPISSKIKAAELAASQILLMKGLISRGFRITASASDGAAVERNCQRQVAAVGETFEHCIPHPHRQQAAIVITLHVLDGNVWVIIQDSKHGLKTIRNNEFSGARCLIIGAFPVHYEQVYTLAMVKTSPLYHRDVVKSDRQDDPAALRLFSAAMLEASCQNPSKNLGLTIYLFVFGEFIDSYQSRTLGHKQRALIAFRTLLFLETWRSFLQKQGYTESRYFISKEAYDICKTLANGILGLILIHRDHLAEPCPLLPWKNASEGNEHKFSDMRLIAPDFSMLQALLMMPRLDTLSMASTGRPRFSKHNYKATANGYQHTGIRNDDSIDLELLSQYPTDAELSAAYATASEENDALWTLLGCHPEAIKTAPVPSLIPIPVDTSPDAPELEEDDDDDEPNSDLQELQNVIDSISQVPNLSAAEDRELDACTYASVALALNELARINEIPEADADRVAEIKAHVAHALATQPHIVIALLQSASATLAVSSTDTEAETVEAVAQSLFDITVDDLTPLVSIRFANQTIQAKTGVRNYRPSNFVPSSDPEPTKELSDRQKLAQQMNTIISKSQERGSSTGLNRSARWKDDSSGPTGGLTSTAAATGNSANAVVAAKGRASDVIKRRRNIFGKKLACIATVAEARVDTDHPLKAESYGFVMESSELMLARVITMYSKNAGKGGAHAWVSTSDSIGALSYIVVQLYQFSHRRLFKVIHRKYVVMNICRFAHLPSNSFLTQIDSKHVSASQSHIEINAVGFAIYEELTREKDLLEKAVISLNTVRRKGKGNVSLFDVEEDDGVGA